MNYRSVICRTLMLASCVLIGGGVSSCAQVNVPEPRNVDIPNPVTAEKRREAVNERPDSVVYLPLGEDVLVPERIVGQDLPSERVGPFELRGETLAGALQLVLADYDISIAFESDQGMTKKVTVANLKGELDKVVSRVCSLADLYCSYEDGTIVVKDEQTFTVTLPPLGSEDGGTEYITNIITGLSAVLGGGTPVSDPTTRTIIYSATNRTSRLAENYFQRLRANTAMIVFETYIWEVSLDAGNSTGVQWDRIGELGKFNASVDLSGGINGDFTNPVTIGLPTLNNINGTPARLLEFLSSFGAVKAISQPQITVLSGASAELRVADTENYVSEVTQTISGDNTATSVSTDSVDSGFTLGIASSWDKSTIYANIDINLSNVDEIDNFVFDTDAGGGETRIQLPQTTERELKTQIRVRPGDSVLIAGLVRERDNFSSRGPGFMKPVFPDSRTARTDNLELVIMLRPRVVVYTNKSNSRYGRGVTNQAQDLLQSSLQRRASVPAYQAPASLEPAAAPESLDTIIEEVALAPVVPAAPPVVLRQPVPPPVLRPQQQAVIPAPLPAQLALPSPPVAVTARTVEPAPSYADSGYRSTGGLTRGENYYTPRRTATYEGGRVFEQANIQKNVVADVRRTPSSSYQPSTSDSVLSSNAKPIEKSFGAEYPSRVAPSSTGPMSANIYNNAKRINVYDIYNRK